MCVCGGVSFLYSDIVHHPVSFVVEIEQFSLSPLGGQVVDVFVS